jgi:anti-anti-sigma regulatory factor
MHLQKGKAGRAVLRITHSEKNGKQWLTLCGQLKGPWVVELRACFEHHRHAAESFHTVVDLSDVTFIDESGEKLLWEMRRAGTEFVARGVATKHLLKNLGTRGERPLRRCIAPLVHACEKFRAIKNGGSE